MTLLGTYGLYIIPIEKTFLNGNILAVAFANASTGRFLSLGTKIMLKSLK